MKLIMTLVAVVGLSGCAKQQPPSDPLSTVQRYTQSTGQVTNALLVLTSATITSDEPTRWVVKILDVDADTAAAIPAGHLFAVSKETRIVTELGYGVAPTSN
jgi:hypothetical protein